MRFNCMLFSFLIFSTLASSCIGQPEPTENYPHTAVLDPGGQVKLYWKFDDIYITFEVHGNTTGWLGMGISPSGSMKDADIVVGWVKNGMAVITDRHGIANKFPPLDPDSNVDLLEGVESEGWTVIKYRRQLASCEEGYDLPITDETLKILYAFGGSDPEGEDIVSEDYHFGNRGGKSLVLLGVSGAEDSVYPEGEEHDHFDLLNERFAIPAETTYYNCRMFKIPELTEKRHLVTVEPIIQSENERYVHHMIVYECRDNMDNEELVGTDTRCYASNMPIDFSRCTSVIHAWAVGGSTMHYPSHTGFPLGDVDSPKYVVIETHYDNPLKQSGVIDSSGLRFIHTGQLRLNDAGVIVAGHGVSGIQHLIPPHADSFLSYGECTSECLEKTMKRNEVDGINLFGVLLHSHLLGHGIKLRQVRDGVELPYIAKDGSYDFNYQETRIFSEERVVLPRDNLQVVCDYKSKDRENMTVGGLANTQEMCIAFVFYYPKISLQTCESAPDPIEMLNYVGIEDVIFPEEAFGLYGDISDVIITKPDEIANLTVADYLNSMTWDDETNTRLEDAFRFMNKTVICAGTQFIPGVKNRVPPLVIEKPYEEKADQCIRDITTESPNMNEDTTSGGSMTMNMNIYICAMTAIVIFLSV